MRRLDWIERMRSLDSVERFCVGNRRVGRQRKVGRLGGDKCGHVQGEIRALTSNFVILFLPSHSSSSWVRWPMFSMFYHTPTSSIGKHQHASEPVDTIAALSPRALHVPSTDSRPIQDCANCSLQGQRNLVGGHARSCFGQSRLCVVAPGG